MIFKRKRKEEQNIINCANLQYRKAVDTADLYMKSKEYTITEKQILLDYMIDIIKRDIQSEYIADLFYHDEAKTMRMPMFPEIYYDKDGKEHELKFSENQEISLKEKCVITFPWERKRMSDNIINIVKNGFKNYPINHDVYYYKDLNIWQVLNGNHSIATGIYTQKGTVLAKVIDMKPLFENIETDGEYFYNIYNGVRIREVQDFRVAVIFEIAKMKDKLENEMDP